MFELRENCKQSAFRVPNHETGDLVGEYADEDEAMRAAQDCGLLRPGESDEGGPSCGVLVDSASIKET